MGTVVVWTRIPELMAFVEARSRYAVVEVAEKVAMTAKRWAPVDTGQLRDSIHTESITAGKEAYVVVEAPYAAYVEYGTYKMAAQPFLYPAVERHAEDLNAEFLGMFASF